MSLAHIVNLGGEVGSEWIPPSSWIESSTYPAGNYMFKVNNRNTRTRCEICSKLTIKTPKRR